MQRFLDQLLSRRYSLSSLGCGERFSIIPIWNHVSCEYVEEYLATYGAFDCVTEACTFVTGSIYLICDSPLMDSRRDPVKTPVKPWKPSRLKVSLVAATRAASLELRKSSHPACDCGLSTTMKLSEIMSPTTSRTGAIGAPRTAMGARALKSILENNMLMSWLESLRIQSKFGDWLIRAACFSLYT